MGRRELREQLFKLLFRKEFHPAEDMQEQQEMFFTDVGAKPATEEEQTYINEKYGRIVEKLPEIDKMLNEKATGWTTTRMGKVDLTILRLAVYEMLFDDDIPVNVAINEAVELAKKFGQDESSSFVNGVLAKFV
ncbi:MAG: transcription antitermination factor NusB [Lachnospiraceae bacterium]|nr:transcription antitermination factor NusB [Lachnospiraceae bacterium]